ncbi:MAG TPA: hypothetical protein ENI96_11130 [Sedimenticola thiotaurini]|uniref:Uncharacterized protein n=1 Tax=Sedimenticola thiotaurini TaxID=1543721 RepID=A0A831RLN9_9GAMM|nr:hypothetical protein [Sedimenticola thiotaurini]
MKFQISDEESHKAKIPHEIFLTNLIGNHILWFIAALGMAKSYWQPVALVPLVSIALLGYTLWRARRSRAIDPWYVMCHWQICARRSRIFIYMLLFTLAVSFLGWLGYSYLGWMPEAVYALVGGAGLLPVMVTVLVLILMESDALHQAALHKLPDSIVQRWPNPGVPVIEEQASAE